jgi:hypothetical protein
MKKLLLAVLLFIGACSDPDKVHVVTVEYMNGDKVCKSFIGKDIRLDDGELEYGSGGFFTYKYATLASGVRDFEITSTGELTSK